MRPPKDRIDEFEALLEPHLDTAYRVALRMSKNPDDASDLVQEAVLSALSCFGSFATGTNFRAWFLRILTNAYLQSLRRAGRIETTDIDDAPDLILFKAAAASGMTTDEGDPAAELMSQVAVEQVAQATDALPDDYRLTMSLYLLNEMSYEEIAQISGVPLGTVRSRIHRARNQLQRRLAHLLEDQGMIRAGGPA